MMLNPKFAFGRLRDLLAEFEPSRERDLAATRLDECEMWLARCTPAARPPRPPAAKEGRT